MQISTDTWFEMQTRKQAAMNWINQVFSWDWSTIATVYASVLSTILLAWQFVSQRVRVKVQCKVAVAFGNRGEPLELVEIMAINVGNRPVEMSSTGFLLTHKSQLIGLVNYVESNPFPKLLSTGESVAFRMTMQDVIDQIQLERQKTGNPDLMIKHAFMRDSAGKQFLTGPPRILRDRGLAR